MEVIVLAKYSSKGFSGFVQAPNEDRKSTIMELFDEAGGTFKDMQFLRGLYDVMIRFEIDDFETLAAVKILVLSSGSISEFEILEIVDMKSIQNKLGSLKGSYRPPGE